MYSVCKILPRTYVGNVAQEWAVISCSLSKTWLIRISLISV